VDREHRVRRRDDFARIRREGRRLAHPLLRLQWTPNALPITRFGFIVSKRVAMRAHERNLIRRRLRELARAELARLSTGYDVVVTAQPSAKGASYQELGTALRTLLQRARLWRADVPESPARR
jgi:ribonuclease P protein component